MVKKKIFLVLVVIVLVGGLVNYYTDHYQGGEIYEATQKSYLVERGFKVTVSIKTVDNETIKGELYTSEGSSLIIIINNSRISVGGPSATNEDVRAKKIDVLVKGKVFKYDLPFFTGKFENILEKLKDEDAYSERFTGTIYLNDHLNGTAFAELKYNMDFLTYGSISLEESYSEGMILNANMIPIELLEKYLSNKEGTMYGNLHVNSEKDYFPFKLREVNTQ